MFLSTFRIRPHRINSRVGAMESAINLRTESLLSCIQAMGGAVVLATGYGLAQAVMRHRRDCRIATCASGV
ncbi:hypothetical protein BH10ACT9_BH10ACT9_58670 [soil metagenome]